MFRSSRCTTANRNINVYVTAKFAFGFFKNLKFSNFQLFHMQTFFECQRTAARELPKATILRSLKDPLVGVEHDQSFQRRPEGVEQHLKTVRYLITSQNL